MANPKAKWNWGSEEQKAFEEAKRMVSREAILTYPDFTNPFHIYTDASDYQLGAVIMQEEKPLAFYTCKLNKAQTKYTTGEQELLSIVETLKSFENILLGQKVIVYTDHLNLLYQKLASNRMIRWQMMLEEFGPKFKHIQGKRNVVADALSRLPLEYKEEDLQETERELPELSYVNQKDIQEETFPMLPSLIAKEQIKDKQLQKTVKNNDKREYYTKKIEGVRLIHYRKKIDVPSKLQAC